MLAVPCKSKIKPVIPPSIHGLKTISSQPKESDLTLVDTPEFAYTFLWHIMERQGSSLIRSVSFIQSATCTRR